MNYLYYMEEVRKIIRDTLKEGLGQEKRYVATVEFYVWANSDEEAKAQAAAVASELDAKYDNRASVKEIGGQQFGTLDYNKIDL